MMMKKKELLDAIKHAKAIYVMVDLGFCNTYVTVDNEEILRRINQLAFDNYAARFDGRYLYMGR